MAEIDLDNEPICKQNVCFADSFKIAIDSLNNQFGNTAGFNDTDKLMMFGVDDWENSSERLAQSFNANKFSSLELFGCDLKQAAAEGIAQGLRTEGARKITKLDIDNSPLNQASAKTIIDAIVDNQSVANLNLQGSVKDLSALRAITEALTENGSVQTLDLKINEVSKEGAEFIASMLRRNQALLSIDLFYNNVQAAGASSIARSLQDDQCMLQILNLCCNHVGDEGAVELGNALKLNRTLRELHLALNDIKDDGVSALCYSLNPELENKDHVNDTLKVLDISANEIGDESVIPLCRVIQYNNTMDLLDFTGIECNKDSWDSFKIAFLSHGMQDGRSPPRIRFSIVDVHEDALDEITEVLQENDNVDWKRKN